MNKMTMNELAQKMNDVGAGRPRKNMLIDANKPAKAKFLALGRTKMLNPDDIIPMDKKYFKAF